MPDISMCANHKCPLRETCYRFMVKPSEYQSYSEFDFRTEHGETVCEYFLKLYNKCK